MKTKSVFSDQTNNNYTIFFCEIICAFILTLLPIIFIKFTIYGDTISFAIFYASLGLVLYFAFSKFYEPIILTFLSIPLLIIKKDKKYWGYIFGQIIGVAFASLVLVVMYISQTLTNLGIRDIAIGNTTDAIFMAVIIFLVVSIFTVLWYLFFSNKSLSKLNSIFITFIVLAFTIFTFGINGGGANFLIFLFVCIPEILITSNSHLLLTFAISFFPVLLSSIIVSYIISSLAPKKGNT